MDISKNDLYKSHKQRSKIIEESYEKLYGRCINTIKFASNAGELICLFEIPAILLGYPLINVTSCADYIITKLTNRNKYIRAYFIEPNIIFIDWRKEI